MRLSEWTLISQSQKSHSDRLLGRYLPAAAGAAALFFAYEALAESGTVWGSALLTVAPLAVALTVMPGVYLLVCLFDASIFARRIRRKCGLTH